jgi:hypothetical protein
MTSGSLGLLAEAAPVGACESDLIRASSAIAL